MKIRFSETTWESQYLAILWEIYHSGDKKETRQIDAKSGQPLCTKGINGASLVVRKAEGIPLLTVRPLGGALPLFIAELLWICSGRSDVELLNKYGVPYWNQWATIEMTTRAGTAPGNFGRIYGPQWVSYYGISGEPYNQLQALVWKLKNEPYDKRMVLFAYHPADSHKIVNGAQVSNMPVRTCHGNIVFSWDGAQTISFSHFQLSADFPIGVPSNLVMYQVLLHLLCRLTGFEAGDGHHFYADAHMYSNQFENVETLLTRKPAEIRPEIRLSDALVDVFGAIISGIQDPLATKEFNPEGLPYLEWIKQQVSLEAYYPAKKIDMPVAT